MVKYTDIFKAFREKLEEKFIDIPIVSESDVTEKIVRPSFMLVLDDIKAEDFMSECADKSLTARIYYFSTTAEKNKLENLKMIDELEELFLNKNITANDFNIGIEDYDINMPDKVLEYSMNVTFSERYNRVDTETENMEEIEVNIHKED